MKQSIFSLMIFAAAVSPAARAYADSSTTSLSERKVERLQDDVSELQTNLSDNGREKQNLLMALAKAKVALKEATAARQSAEDQATGGDPAATAALEKATRAEKSASFAAEAAQAEFEGNVAAARDLKDQINLKEDKIDRLSSAKSGDGKANVDCPDGSCAGGKKGAPNGNDQDKTNWQGIADIVKAVTPLGLGAMSTYLGYEAQKTASADYRYYSANNTALGLPSAAPSTGAYGGYFANGAGGLFGQGGLSVYAGLYGGALAGGLACYGAYGGLGYGTALGFGAGVGGYPAGYGGYGTPYGAYGEGTGVNYGYAHPTSLSSAYGANQAAAASRMAQQQSIFASDASSATAGLSSAYSAYTASMNSLSGTGYTGSYQPASYVNYNYGAGSYFAPVTNSVYTRY